MRVLIFALLSLVSFALFSEEYEERDSPSAADCALPGFDCSNESSRQLKKTNLALRKALRSLTVEQGVGRDAVPRGRETKIGASNHGFKHVRKAGEQAVGCSSDADCNGSDFCWPNTSNGDKECWPAYVEPVCYSDSDCPGWADICYKYNGVAECYDPFMSGRETKIGASNHGLKHVRKAGEQAVGGYKLGEGCSSDADCPGLDTCWSTECWPAYVEPVCYSDSDCPGWADICIKYYDGTAECYDPFMSGRETKIGASNHGFKNEASVGRKRKTAAKKTESDTNKEHSAEKEIGLAKANTRLLKSNKMLLHALKKVSATSDGISWQQAVGGSCPWCGRL